MSAKELGKVVIKLCTKSEIKEGTIKNEEAAWEVSGMSLARCMCLFFLVICFHVG